MKSIEDSHFLKSRIESACDEDGFFGYTTEQKISKLKNLKKWVKDALENSMYPEDETKRLKDLRNDIDSHILKITSL